jgi:hypothetical protein
MKSGSGMAPVIADRNACGNGLALVIPDQQVRRDREPLEIVGVERRVTINGFQQSIRFGPRPLLERLPPPPQCREIPHIARLDTVDRSVAMCVNHVVGWPAIGAGAAH